MGKESITLSMELAKTQCYEFECFDDNYSRAYGKAGIRNQEPESEPEPEPEPEPELKLRPG